MKSLSIGSLKLKNPLILAPMVEVTDFPYRELCRKAGCSLSYTEMIHLNALLHTNPKTEYLAYRGPREKPLGIQVTGPSVELFKQSLPRFARYDIVDINCGCPSTRITDGASGSYLLKSPEKIASYIRTLKDAGLIATAKIRLGFKLNNALTVARAVEKAGADALTVHARLASQGNSTPADWSWIAKIKKQLGIPVIGNGDVATGAKAAEMLEIADGAMIARAAIGDPYVFERMLSYLRTGKEKTFSVKKNLKAFNTYLALTSKQEYQDVGRVKYVGTQFLRGFEGAASARNHFMACKTVRDMKEFLKTLSV